MKDILKRTQGATNTKSCTWCKISILVKFKATENSLQAVGARLVSSLENFMILLIEKAPLLEDQCMIQKSWCHRPSHYSALLFRQLSDARSASLTLGKFWHKGKDRTQGDIGAT